MFVLTRDLIVGDEVSQLLDEAHHLLVPGDVGHGEVAGRAFAAVRHALRRNMETVTISLTLPQAQGSAGTSAPANPRDGLVCSRFTWYLTERQ